MSDDEYNTKEGEICLHARLSLPKAYVINSGAANHMVASIESFITLHLLGGTSSHMGDDSKIPYVEIGSDKIQHDEFNNVLNFPSSISKKFIQDEEEAQSSTQSIQIEESLLGVTPSPAALEVYEISDISSSHIADQEEDIQISVTEGKLPFHST